MPDGPGFWYPPTVVTGVTEQSRVANDEIFGPVVTVIPFDDEDDAARLANATPYGLSGSVWTARRRRGVAHGPRRRERHAQRELEQFGPLLDAVRWVQAERHRPRPGMQALDHYSETKTVYTAVQ